jgi:hypothetical protein
MARLTNRRPGPGGRLADSRFTPHLTRLEERDVPAVYYVDPRATALNPTFNDNLPGEFTGTFGVDVFDDLLDAINTANANPGADTIRLSYGGDPNPPFNGIIPIFSAANTPVDITDSLSIVGSGAGASRLQAADTQDVAVFRVLNGATVNLSHLSYNGSGQGFDGSGNVIGPNASSTRAFIQYTAGTSGTIDSVSITGVYANGFNGQGVDVIGATVTVQNSQFADMGIIGVRVTEGARIQLFDNTYLGKGTGNFLDYFTQLSGGSTGVISGNLVSGNQGTGGAQSAAIAVFHEGGIPSSAQIFGNTFTANDIAVAVGFDNTDTSTADLRYNNIFGNNWGVFTVRAPGTAPINATNVWWGHPTGPFNATNNPTGLGNRISDDVLFAPVRTAPLPVDSAPTLTQYLSQNGLFTNPALVGQGQFAAGSGEGGNAATVYNPDGSTVFTLSPFTAGFAGGVRVAMGDFNGDGVLDLAVASGPGAQALVRIIDGSNQQELFAVTPFGSFDGGAFVTAGDLTGDGIDDLVITPDQGGGPRVVIYRGGDFVNVASFLGINDINFRGGARAGVGDINGDGRVDLIVSAGFLGGPRVAVWNGLTVTTGTPAPLFNDFFAFDPALRNGAFVSAADVNGDGFADLIAGAGPGGGPEVKIYSGADLIAGLGANATRIADFFAGDIDNREGVHVVGTNLDGDNLGDLVVGSATNGQLTAYFGTDLAQGLAIGRLSFSPFFGFGGGIFVG